MERRRKSKNLSVEIPELSRVKYFLIFFSVFSTLSSLLWASEESLLRLKGEYLAYSYDHNQIYGEKVEFNFAGYSVSSLCIKADLLARTFYAYGNVTLRKDSETLLADEFLFEPQQKKGSLIRYKDRIEAEKIGEEKEELPFFKSAPLEELNLAKIQKSFIYFIGQDLEVTADFEVYGYNMTLFIEGLESVRFKKFRLSGGIDQRRNGISLNKVWYTKSQGLVGRVSYFYEKKEKANSLTQLNYEEHSVLKDYPGLKRQVDVMSSTTLNLGKDLSLGLTGNYNSSNLWNTGLWLNKKWSNETTTQVSFSYNKPVSLKGETWLGLQSTLDAGKFGNISFSGKYETQNQLLSYFSYGNTVLNRIHFLLSSSYSKVSIGGSRAYSEILSGGIDLSYGSRIFNLSLDYYLNYDLFGEQLLSQPQLRLGLTPFQLYGGLLTASLYNTLIYSNLKRDGFSLNNFSNNTGFRLTTQPVFIQKGLSLNWSAALEQFTEKEGRNFTSGGLIFNGKKDLAQGISFEGFYSVQSRRKTRGWLIEGTTSQDLSAILKVHPSPKFDSWVSLSYDPKNSQWRQSFADFSVAIIKNWRFHSLLNYDFLLNKLYNVDLYLIREAGRLQLRLIWRSLSKQFLVELVPR